MAWYISNGLIFAYLVLCLCFNMKSKINKVATFFAIFVPLSTFALSQKVIEPYTSPVIHVAITWTIFSVLAWLIFDERPKTKFLITFIIIVINYATSIIATVTTFIFVGNVYQPNLPIVIFYHTLTLAVLAVFTLVRKKIEISGYNFKVFLVVGIIQLLFAEIAILFIVYGGNPFSPDPPNMQSGTSNSFAIIVIAAASLFYVVSDIVIFLMMRKLSQTEKAKEELRFREYKNQMNFDYYKSVEKNAEEMRKLRHDMANILQVAGRLIEGSEKDKETSEQLLSQIRREFSEIHLEKYTENSLVNAIVSNKAAVCRENGITCSFDIRIPEKLEVDEIDICKAYVNIIDNAINAVMLLESEKKNIELKSFIENGSLCICSKNLYSEDSAKEKKNSADHGFGQKILADIADKYNGRFLTEQTEEQYTAMLLIKV